MQNKEQRNKDWQGRFPWAVSRPRIFKMIALLVSITLWGGNFSNVSGQEDAEAKLAEFYKKSNALIAERKFSEANIHAEKTLEWAGTQFGKDHKKCAPLLMHLAILYARQGKLKETEPLLLRGLKISEKQSGLDHPDTANFLKILGALYTGQSKDKEAGLLFLRALKIYEKHLGPVDPYIATPLNSLALSYFKQGKYEEAEPLLLRVLKITVKKLGADHLDTVGSLNFLVALYSGQSKYEDAEPLSLRVLKIREKTLGLDHPSTATSLVNLAAVYRERGKYEEAELLFLRALKIREEKLGPDHPSTATSLVNLAALYGDQGKYEEAEPLYLRALEITEKLTVKQLDSEHMSIKNSLNNLAFFYNNQGKYEEAEPLYLRALKISEEKLGSDHPSTAASLNNLAGLYREQGKYEEAEPLYLRALKINEKKLGLDHPTTAISVNNLAVLYLKHGRYEEVGPLYVRALKINEKKLGPDHPTTAVSLNNLAHFYAEFRKYEEAESLYLRALKIYEKNLVPDHPDTAPSLNNLASLYYDQGKYEKAEPLYVRALKINEKKLGPDHPDTADSLTNLGGLYHKQGKYGEAASLIDRGLLGQHHHQTRMLRYFPDRDCLAMQSRLETDNAVGNVLNGELVATEQIWFKGAVLEGMNQRRIAESTLASTKEGAQLLHQRQILATAYQKSSLETGPGSEKTKELEALLSDLEKQIAVALQGKDGILQIGTIDLASVRKALGEKEILIESFRYYHKTAETADEYRYSTALIRSTGEADYIAHGSAEFIEETIEKFRRGGVNKDGGLSSEERESLFAEAEKTLYQQFLTPIEAKLSADDTVIFSLDAQLLFIPPGMLRDENGIPFGGKFNVRYVTSGRDLVKEVPKRSNGSGNKKALVLGNPTYRDNAPLMALAEAEEEKAAKLVAANLRAGMSNDTASINLRPLPGTAREVAQLEGKLQAKGYEVTSLSRKDASEEAVKQSIEGCDIVHLATHGFFLNEIKIGKEKRGLNGEPKINPNTIQDPMYRSGLALSGAQSTFNLWKNGEVPPPSKDGILMAVEAALLNLRGTDLVVLSACETATGKVLDGEGVMGLRRALSAAGATNTILTLWPVNDQATVEVMEAFYEKYLAGTPAPKALAEVQRELFPKWIEEYGVAEAIARLGPFICTSIGPVE